MHRRDTHEPDRTTGTHRLVRVHARHRSPRRAAVRVSASLSVSLLVVGLASVLALGATGGPTVIPADAVVVSTPCATASPSTPSGSVPAATICSTSASKAGGAPRIHYAPSFFGLLLAVLRFFGFAVEAPSGAADSTTNGAATPTAGPTPTDSPTPAAPGVAADPTASDPTAPDPTVTPSAIQTPDAIAAAAPAPTSTATAEPADPQATADPTPTVAATVNAATPSASPSPSPTSTAAADAADGGRFTAAFGTRPESGIVNCSGRSGVTITGLSFEGIGNDQPAITIMNCHDVVISQNDFIDDTEPIYVQDSTNVTITANRYRNITGPYQRNGSHRGNFTQWQNSFGGSIDHNVGIGGNTEDIVSIFQSGGADSAHPLVIEDNTFQGTNWTSASGSGIMLGDGGGSHVIVRNNTLINPGQVGIGVAGGSDIHVLDNTVYGEQRANSNVGISTWGQGSACSDIEVAGNTVDFVKDTGVVSGAWDGQNCGTIAGWSSNDFTATLNPAALEPVL